MTPNESIEALVACCGVIRPTVTDAKIEASFKLVDQMVRRLTSWVKNPEPREFTLPFQAPDKSERVQTQDAEKLFDRLGKAVDFTDEAAALSDETERTDFSAAVNDIRAELVRRYPVTVATDYLADEVFPLCEDEKQDWLALVVIAEEKMRILDELEMGTITPEQVEVFRFAFPSIYQRLAHTVDDIIIDINAKGGELSDPVESALQVFLATGQFPGVQLPAEPEPAPQKNKTKLESSGQKTLSERLASR